MTPGISMAARKQDRRANKAGGWRRKGQALVEMAFVMGILMMLSLGIVQFGIVYSTSIQLTNLAREGARFGAIHGSDPNVEAQVEDYVQKNCKGTTIPVADLPDGAIAVVAANKTPGYPIKVTLVYDMRKKFFIPTMPIGFMSNNDNRWSQFTQTATMTIE